jgi:uncharacterized protein (DUF1499 family)
MVRSGAWQQGLMLYAIACFGSALLVILSLVLLLLPRFAPWRKSVVQRALPAIPGAVLLLSLLSGGGSPRIHDITTDTVDPPLFVKAETQRGADSNSLDINQDVILLQREAYPDVQSLHSTLSFDAAYNRAEQVAKDLGWEIYNQDRNAGVIEAVDTTAIMAFKDDVVIRVRTNAKGSVIDLRSVSRVGEGDLGANTKRIVAFTEAYQEQG